MPLIPKKSKKVMSEAEMTGEPGKQSIAIAYGMKRKKGVKKFAEGGKVNESAASERRPSPEEHDKDSKEVSSNSGDKAPRKDSWTDKSTVKQAQKNNGRTVMPIKRPSMVPSDAFSTKMRDEEADLEMTDSPAPYDEQPPMHDDEEDPDRQGPEVHPMKMMAEGGKVPPKSLYELMTSSSKGQRTPEQRREIRSHPDYRKVWQGNNPFNSQTPPETRKKGSFARGGVIDQEPAREDKGWGAVIVKAEGGEVSPPSEEEIDHAASIAAGIMAKRRMMAEGGDIFSGKQRNDFETGVHKTAHSIDPERGRSVAGINAEGHYETGSNINKRAARKEHRKVLNESQNMPKPKLYAEGGAVDLSENADEEPNHADEYNFEALKKENYSESEGLDALDSPDDSNEHDVEIEHDHHDMVSAIKAKMKRRMR